MNNEDNIIEARGLNRNSNDILLPPGSLVAADESVVIKDNVISRRRGFKLCNNGVPADKPEQLFVSGGVLYAHINGRLYAKNSSCDYTIVKTITPTLNVPTSVWGNSTDLYISDAGNSTIRKFNFASGYMSTFAGSPGVPGTANGVGSAARFNFPTGLWGNATDLYVCDNVNSSIRKITLAGAVVTTFAGLSGTPGSADGVGAAARFDQPVGIWGNATDLYVADSNNSTIRTITIAGAAVTTFAGTAGVPGSANGIGAAARFNFPTGVEGNATDLYIGDEGNQLIRKITLAGAVVTTFAGTAGIPGTTDGIGAAARFFDPSLGSIDATYLYVDDFDNNSIRRIKIANAEVDTFAGLSTYPSSTGSYADGVGTHARFFNPGDMWNNGTYLYVPEYHTHVIRRINLTTSQTDTYIGIPGVPGSSDGFLILNIQGP